MCSKSMLCSHYTMLSGGGGPGAGHSTLYLKCSESEAYYNMFSTLCFTPPQKRSVVRAQHSVVSVMHCFSVVGRSRSKDLLIGRLTILVNNAMNYLFVYT